MLLLTNQFFYLTFFQKISPVFVQIKISPIQLTQKGQKF